MRQLWFMMSALCFGALLEGCGKGDEQRRELESISNIRQAHFFVVPYSDPRLIPDRDLGTLGSTGAIAVCESLRLLSDREIITIHNIKAKTVEGTASRFPGDSGSGLFYLADMDRKTYLLDVTSENIIFWEVKDGNGNCWFLTNFYPKLMLEVEDMDLLQASLREEITTTSY